MLHQTPIRIGVIGTGVMGGHHTRVAATVPGSELIGIYDADLARAESVAATYGITPFSSIEALCARVDAVIVAAPTKLHGEIGAACLRAGCHVLLEKPIAATISEAEELVQLSKAVNRTLMIGHIERYNPAVTTLLSMIDRSEIFAIELERLSIAPGRDRTADIIFDLMIHDLDLALAITDAEPTSVMAMGHYVRCDFIDHVTALLRFASGVTATLTASAVSQERIRRARVFTKSAQYLVDLASRDVEIFRQGQSSIANSDGQYQVTSQVEKLLVPNKEPLAAEQEHFLQAIRTQSQPATHAEAGLAALRLAYTIQQSVQAQWQQ